MELSVIIVNWNAGELLLRTLRSIYTDLFAGEIEVLLVDNASSDGSLEEARQRFPAAHVIANKQNLGYAAATNQGIRASAGRYLLLLNPDTELGTGCLGEVVRFFESHPNAGIVGCRLCYPDGGLQPSGRPFPTPLSALLELTPFGPSCQRASAFLGLARGARDYRVTTEVDEVSGAAMALRRRMLAQVGLLDERFFLFGEDIDLCWRAKMAGWRVYYLPSAVVVHHWGGSRRKANVAAMGLLAQRAYYTFFRLHYPRRQAALFKALLLALTSLKLAKHTAQGWETRPYLRELSWLWRN